MSHTFLAPVRCSSLRSASSSVRRGSAWIPYSVPFTLSLRDRAALCGSACIAPQGQQGAYHQEAHNSTALEGNTLVLREVETLLRDGRAVGNKDLKDYVEVKGYATAAEWVYGR